MTDDAHRAILAAKLNNLRASILTSADLAELREDSELRRIIAKTLDRLREQLEHDPFWADDLLRDVVVTPPAPPAGDPPTES